MISVMAVPDKTMNVAINLEYFPAQQESTDGVSSPVKDPSPYFRKKIYFS